ncbi:hypothetical protein [Dehalococcoides mccartyi]|uniref:hypothetical protein n=1 Tax=Dehalococcoides mccartyi TaxID=61435 RepID=UPI0006BD07A0|nr:hypothetical protein [Dehalococcoides mccartyi]BAS31173.1 hypothetical protein IBK_0098 [Dehalococcoides mccartyi IBARAKI]
MKQIIGIIVAAFGVVAIFSVMPVFTDSAHDLQVDTVSEAKTAVTTGVGETSADVVLVNELYRDRATSVTSITSTVLTDVPVAGTYTAATRTLEVTGLTQSETRTLTINYDMDALEEWTMMSLFVGWTPVLILFGVFALIGGSVWALFHRQS